MRPKAAPQAIAPPLALGARNGASPHHAKGPLCGVDVRCRCPLSLPAAAACCRCLPRRRDCRWPRGDCHEPSAEGPRQGVPLPFAAWRKPRARGGDGDQRREGAREITPVAHTCPPATLLNPPLHPTSTLLSADPATHPPCPQQSVLSPYCAPPSASCWHPCTKRATPSWSSCWKNSARLIPGENRLSCSSLHSPKNGHSKKA